MDQYRLKSLAGMIVSTTGFSGGELPTLRDLITKMDGIYKADMTQSTSLLIAKDIESVSPKLNAARNWKIQIETHEYLQNLWTESHQKESEIEANYFDTTSIFIGDGFHESLVEYLRKIVRMGGGTFMSSFDACVTHYITAGNAPLPKDLEILGDSKYSVKIVSSKWLSDCFIEKKLIDVDSYCWDPESIKIESRTVKEDIDDEDVLKVRKSAKFFSGHSFVVDGFSEEETRILKSNLIQYGGTLSQKNALLIRPFKLKFHTSQNCATEFWVEKCIQSSIFLDINESVLFQPTKITLPIPEGKQLVLGITGFLEVERIWVGRIAHCLGLEF
jgi:hypothetical protein